jgi:hypothetical protein
MRCLIGRAPFREPFGRKGDRRYSPVRELAQLTGLPRSRPAGEPVGHRVGNSCLVSRDLETHFGDGRTGSSTVRRSFASLLHDALDLRGIPRNPDKPGYFANYGLSPEHDAALTAWMRRRLRLAIWARPEGCDAELASIERSLLARLEPPLNLQHVTTPWTAQVKAARRAMAGEARTGAGSEGGR